MVGQSSLWKAQLAIIGGGVGGFAAAWAALRRGLTVVMTEEYDRVGGQFTSQAVPPDEHPWIENFGCSASYRQFRQLVRAYYKEWYPLSPRALQFWETLNPGQGFVSSLCHEPAVSRAVMESLLRPYLSSGQLKLLLHTVPVGATRVGDRLLEVEVEERLEDGEKRHYRLQAPYFIEATETGDLLPLAEVEYRIGREPRQETGEPHAPLEPDPHNQQAISWCMILDYQPEREARLEPPAQYDFWRQYVPQLTPPWSGPLLSWTATHPITLEPVERSFDPLHPQPERGPMDLWTFRRLAWRENFEYPAGTSELVLVNWPQIDYLEGNIVEVTPQEKARHLEGARQLSLSLLYWMQTEAPRPDGGKGWPGLGLRPDVAQTADGLARAPYVREARRLKGLFTVYEQHVSLECRCQETGLSPQEVRATQFSDSVGIGAYRLDLHPTTRGQNYLDVSALPFQIPLGSLLAADTVNLLAGGKTLSVTHITNGCYRLHPVEWGVGEAAALCVAYALERGVNPHQIYAQPAHLEDLQNDLSARGLELEWPQEIYPL